ncbi:hypothetical protein DSO57_1008714 [Entomophthora muscae]|uniref:Uncharacterized protein n=1 Tax=Entomophthora muscae TaxID=34485 RepID=A0ACC2SW70_9FUNG|nr:hypothetical protein DSO57_1008714 [Entomophthora muscae]
MGQGLSRYWVEQRKEKIVSVESTWFVPGETLKRWCEESNKSFSGGAHAYFKTSRLLHCFRVGFPSRREQSQEVTECVQFFTNATSYEYDGDAYVDVGFASKKEADEAMKMQLYLHDDIVPKTRPCLATESLCLLIFRNIPSTLTVSKTDYELNIGLQGYGRVLAHYVEKDSKFPNLTRGSAYAALAVPIGSTKPIPKESFFKAKPAEKFTVICHVKSLSNPPDYSSSKHYNSITSSKDLCCWGD